MLKRKSLVLVKKEVTYGVDPVPTPAANAILVEDLKVKVAGDLLTRKNDKPSLSPSQHVIGMKEVEVSFLTELKGSGTANAGGAGDAPEIAPLLRACGFAETLTAESGAGVGDGFIEYDPVSAAFESYTIYGYLDGILHKVTGCRGNFNLNCEVGQYGKLSWTFKGLYLAPVDAVIPGGAAYSAQIPKPFFNASFTIGGYPGIIQALSLSPDNKIVKRLDANAAEGVAEFMLTERGSKGSVNPEAVTEATHAFWAAWKNGTPEALSATVGTTAGAKVLITAPKVQYQSVDYADREGVRTYDLPLTLAENTGDDEMKLKFF